MSLIRAAVRGTAVFVSLVGLVSPAHAQPIVGALPHDLSSWGMFLGADIIVQGVMVGLAFASVVTWTVLVAKSLELLSAVRRQRAVLATVDGARSFGDVARLAGGQGGDVGPGPGHGGGTASVG